MPADLDLTVPATTRGLAAALQTLERTCAGRGVAAHLVLRARVVVEELFTNAIKYGYGGESERPVRLSVEVGAVLTLVIEDEAPHFDPTSWRPAADLPANPAERPPGQAGIAMVMGLSTKVIYAPLPGGNRITLVF